MYSQLLHHLHYMFKLDWVLCFWTHLNLSGRTDKHWGTLLHHCSKTRTTDAKRRFLAAVKLLFQLLHWFPFQIFIYECFHFNVSFKELFSALRRCIYASIDLHTGNTFFFTKSHLRLPEMIFDFTSACDQNINTVFLKCYFPLTSWTFQRFKGRTNNSYLRMLLHVKWNWLCLGMENAHNVHNYKSFLHKWI